MPEKEKSFYELVKCVLSDEEKLRLGREIADANGRLDESDKELKSVQTQIKARIKQDKALVALCSEKLRSGYEYRRVECRQDMDYRGGIVRVIRLDNFEVVRSRAMEDEERQKQLDFGGDGNGDRPEFRETDETTRMSDI